MNISGFIIFIVVLNSLKLFYETVYFLMLRLDY